jgi:hypothetical protein
MLKKVIKGLKFKNNGMTSQTWRRSLFTETERVS